MKRGNAGSAGSLIGVILLLFLFYVIFLPPADRDALLQEDRPGLSDGSVQGNTILAEGVGKLDFVPATVKRFAVPNAYLQETAETHQLAQVGFFNVRRTLFGSTDKKITFPAQTDRGTLTFQVEKSAGVLSITLNNQNIFQNTVVTPTSVILPNLQKENTLTFSVDGRFFQTKRYDLSDVKILENVPVISKQIMRYDFSLSEDEHAAMNRAVYTFFPNCVQQDAGTLTITLNDAAVSQNVPSCDAINVEEIDKSELRVGKNTLGLALDQGRVNIAQGVVEISFTPVDSYIKYFSIPANLVFDAQRGISRVVLKMTFVDDGSPKRAILNVNGVLDAIDQTGPVFERDVSRIIRGGNNYVSITPKSPLEILELEIRAE